MDEKKPYSNKPASGRASGFLLGLVVVLSILLAALEFTTRDESYEAADNLLDDLSLDMETAPLAQQKDMVAAVRRQRPTPNINNIRLTDEAVNDDTDDQPLADESADASANGSDYASSGGDTDSRQSEEDTRNAVVAIDQNDNPLDIKIVETLPEFPGGMSAFVKWLSQNLQYPAQARQQNIQGRVLVAFIINKDGSVTDPKIVTSVSPELDRETLRVMRLMPKWKAGEYRGEPCRTYFRVPVVFKL